MLVKMYTDGAARGNPEGPGGYGVILSCTDKDGNLFEREYSGGYRRTSNNRMELMAVITGFEQLLYPCTVEVYSDSKYVVDAFNQHWIDSWIRRNWRTTTGPVKNIDLWKRLLEAKEPHVAKITPVPGGVGAVTNSIMVSHVVRAAVKAKTGEVFNF